MIFNLRTLVLLITCLPFSGTFGAQSKLSADQKAEWEHRSMGSNPFPFVWFKALNSVTHLDLKKKPNLPLYGTHEQNQLRYGLQKSDYNEINSNEGSKKYLLDTTGLTVSWSNSWASEPHQDRDVYYDESELLRKLNGVVSAKFVGINCALCHQSNIYTDQKKITILGAPSQVDINGFYTDIVTSTIALFIKKDLLVNFLNKVKQQNPSLKNLNVNIEAKKFLKQFKDDVTFTVSNGKEGLFNLGYYYTMLTAKIFNDKTEFRKIKGPLKAAYIRLFRLTHQLKDSDQLGEIEDFATWFSERGIGDPDSIKKTNYYFGRSDAMGSLGNAEIRGEDQGDLTAPVGYPWVWGTQFMAFAHYTANMNNPVHRNIGAALAVGATYSVEHNRTSINLAAVKDLENIMHQISAPDWNDVFNDQIGQQVQPDFQINNDRALKGKEIYQNKCASCHESSNYVGPRKLLLNSEVYDLSEIGTDPNEALNLARSVFNKSFAGEGEKLTSRVAGIYFDQNNISAEDQRKILELDLRGPPVMRETFLGSRISTDPVFEYFNLEQGSGYKARHLSGAWATAPFLHNDSIPTIADLLTPGIDRPTSFTVSGKFEFDPKKLGLKTTPLSDCNNPTPVIKGYACIDTKLTGNSNQGHEYGTTDLTADEKLQLIEYLKVLPAEPGY